MNNYSAWIKELSAIVYDNSKSEYQILSELIPILLNIKSSQDTNSELMDTIHDDVFTKVTELENGMNTFSETFIGKLNEFKQEFTPHLEEFTSTLESNINAFKEKINNKISSFNTTYASEKTSIQDIADSINNINDTLISGYNEILNKINNYIPNIINSNDTSNFIYNTIVNKFNDDFNNRESNYINLVSVTTQPATANENDIYYNASENKLYQYTNSSWNEIDFVFDKIYKFNNHLYLPQLVDIEIGKPSITIQVDCVVDETHYLGHTSNVGTKVYFTLVDSTTFKFGNQINIETPPEGYSSFSNIIYWNNTYYMLYDFNKLASSTDLVNWTYLMDLPEVGLSFTILNNQLFLYGSINSYMLTSENELIKSYYNMIGYNNGYYYFIGSLQKGSTYVSRIYKNANFSATNEGYEEVYTSNAMLYRIYTNLISANNNYFQSFKSIIFNNDEYIENVNSVEKIIATENILFSRSKVITYKNNIVNQDILSNTYIPYLNFNDYILSVNGVVYDVAMQLQEIR